MDLLIKNAIDLDLDSGIEREVTVGIKEGVIRLIRDASETGKQESAAMASVDAMGAYIFPGWIDFHTHLFTKGSAFGVNGDLLLASGATMAVDMGTAGCTGYEAFRQLDLLPRTIPIKSFINLSPLGQPGAGIAEPLSRRLIQEDSMKALIEKYRDEIRGIKVRLSQEIVGAEGIEPLKHALELGDRFELPVCVHTTDPPVRTSEIVTMLRPGDIYSHVYHKKGMTILSEDGTVLPAFHKAKERGVYLEVGNGRMNFNFDVAEAALSGGIFPDIISSDATAKTFANSPDMKDLAFVISKFWNMGMPLHQAAAAVTRNPARCLGLENERGALAVGQKANLTVARPVRKKVTFSDSDGNVRIGNKLLAPEMTVLDGRIVYLQGAMTLKKE